MKRLIPAALRRLRLRAKLATKLHNAAEVWHAYSTGATPPALRFRNGAVLAHRAQDHAVITTFEVVINGCYRRHLAETDGLVVDIGANVGLFVIDCALRNPNARFHAYEPDAETYAVLRRNIDGNGLSSRVRTYNEAVGGSCGEAIVLRGASSVATTARAAGPVSAAGDVTVAMVDLATVVSRAGRISALKIDVEGAEADIFDGASDETIAEIDQVVGEHHEQFVPGTIERLRSRLTAAGFSFHLPRDPRCAQLFVARRHGA